MTFLAQAVGVPRPFWPHNPETFVLSLSFVVGVAAAWFGLRKFGARGIASWPAKDDYHLKLVEWERDRLMTAAKGFASTSVGFLSAVVTALLKDEISRTVSVLSILGCLLGAIGVLLLGAHWSLVAGRFVREPQQDRL